ncbi:DUF2163 domain-containing protein [Cognatishimia maritima]|uniref:Bacteriophage phiJL001 Gp84 C-terminal domain-containing protein n=1 Tax=Cognatishimia maritima TaxID=870908 RepID=A0A1M5JHD6_9RHOB|nr:DUF2163 domain-containing protein [Cognatishimia maritima]SHG39967.1 phage conserved hypothetical protein BR0599 [Cognatishimia maritima]
MGISAELKAHLESGLTTLARCWQVTRRDGVVLGFTDHDCALSFDGVDFRADSGLTAMALDQATGLAVDNTETLGALSADAITEEDIAAGRYDGADVQCWLVNWAAPTQRTVIFAGQIGEITRVGQAFQAEVRGLSEVLNQPRGRVFQKSCPMGVAALEVDLTAPAYSAEVEVVDQLDPHTFEVIGAEGCDTGWFTHGLFIIDDLSLNVVIKSDEVIAGGRQITLWEPLPQSLDVGQPVRLIAGHDRSFATSRFKFNDALNFRGFPDIPNDDWITTLPRRDGVNDGGSLR